MSAQDTVNNLEAALRGTYPAMSTWVKNDLGNLFVSKQQTQVALDVKKLLIALDYYDNDDVSFSAANKKAFESLVFFIKFEGYEVDFGTQTKFLVSLP